MGIIKTFSEFINEAVEFEKMADGYSIVTLVTREDVDCANLSKEDFIKFISEDLHTAIEEYKKICEPLDKEKFDEYIENEKERAIKYAESKWKTDKKRKEYVDNIIKNCEGRINIFDSKADQIFFDFKPERGATQVLHDVCILKKKTDERQLAACYDEIHDNKYFIKATGWKFKYETHKNDKPGYFSFRPYVDVILDESTKDERTREEEKLNKDIQAFYSHTNYWGD